jgi:Phage integrase SAM-like domain
MGLRTGYSLLYRRQGIYRFRKFVPKDLREIIGKREIKVSLQTSDLDTAKRRLAVEALKADRLFDEARRVLTNPDARAFRAVQQDVEDRRKRPRTDEELDAESLALTDALETATDKPDPVRAKILRAVLEERQRDPAALKATEDNPPLSVLFNRWKAERQPPAKTWHEWSTARKRLEQVIGGDFPVRSITKAMVRQYKESLLRTPRRHGSGATLSPASVHKGLAAVKAVFSWGVSQGYLDVNPADGIRHAGARSAEQQAGRLPYDGREADLLSEAEAWCRHLATSTRPVDRCPSGGAWRASCRGCEAGRKHSVHLHPRHRWTPAEEQGK